MQKELINFKKLKSFKISLKESYKQNCNKNQCLIKNKMNNEKHNNETKPLPVTSLPISIFIKSKDVLFVILPISIASKRIKKSFMLLYYKQTLQLI